MDTEAHVIKELIDIRDQTSDCKTLYMCMCSVLKCCMLFVFICIRCSPTICYRCAIMSYVYFCTVFLWRIKILYYSNINVSEGVSNL